MGASEKLLRCYFGPYVIRRCLSAVSYEVEVIPDSMHRRCCWYQVVVHVARMKPFHPAYEDSLEANYLGEGDATRQLAPPWEQE